MTKNFKRITAIILAIVVIATTFVACKGKTEGEENNPTVNGTTQAEGWSENTTKKDETSTSTSASQSTTESTTKKETTTAKKETTTKTYHNNNNSNSAKPTTTKKYTTTTQKPVTTTKPATKPPVTTTKPAAKKPLTDAQKKAFVDAYFGQFPKHNAKPGFRWYDNDVNDGLTELLLVSQDNYDEQLQWYLDNAIDYDSKNCTRVAYHWTDNNGVSELRYKCITN